MTISKIYVTSLPGMRITVGDHGWQIVTAKREDGAGPGRGNDTRLNQSRVFQMRDSRPCASLSRSRCSTRARVVQCTVEPLHCRHSTKKNRGFHEETCWNFQFNPA